MAKQQAGASAKSHESLLLEYEKVSPLNPLPLEELTTHGAAPSLFITSEFSLVHYNDWLERMGWFWETLIPSHIDHYVYLYRCHDKSLDLQTNCLMPFEQDYIFQLVAIIVGTLTKTPASAVTPTLRALVNMSWQSLCRLGMKLPVLEKLVASSRKPTALTEARKSVEEAMQSWQASSNDLQCMRQILVSKVEETFKSSNDHRALDEVDLLSKLVAAKLKEVENDNKHFNEMKRLELKLANSPWCSFP